LQAYVSKLRRALEPDRAPRGDARVLVKNGGGYQLTICPDQLDALRFEQLLDRASDMADFSLGIAIG
jgi:hypothetical protein